jgi:hypothetical protein
MSQSGTGKSDISKQCFQVTFSASYAKKSDKRIGNIRCYGRVPWRAQPET